MAVSANDPLDTNKYVAIKSLYKIVYMVQGKTSN